MAGRNWKSRGWLAGAAALLSFAVRSQEQPPDESRAEEVVVTGLRVGQGGAQDINYFRGEAQFDRIPHPEILTAEGLLSEHDIVFPAAAPCRQLFCLTGEATRAELLAVPQARYLVGIGFATNIDEKRWRRDPVNLIAVVDKSGSMSGEPLELVRQSLTTLARQLRAGDQLTIVLYGDRAHVHLDTTKAGHGALPALLASIADIDSMGATSMEAGLRLGYQVAYTTAAAFRGRTRLMLFTDERPNADATDAESFMGMAAGASRAGVGLTTVGVGVQFDAALATQVSSVRGGNLYFLRDAADVKAVFTGQLDYMVSELAHDLRLTIAPRAGFRIAGVYGVPGELLGWQNGDTVSVTIPTVFLDNHGGGIFVTLAPAAGRAFLPEAPLAGSLADVAVTYLPPNAARTESHAIAIGMPAVPGDGMKLGRLLIDEFTVLHEATSAHYLRNDQETAYRLLSALRARLDATRIGGLDQERRLIDSLHTRIAFLAGHGAEAPRTTPNTRLWGRWTIDESSDQSGVQSSDDRGFAPGVTLEFTADNRLRVFEPDSAPEEEEYQSNARQIYLPEEEIVFDYRIRGATLTLRERADGRTLRLRKADAG